MTSDELELVNPLALARAFVELLVSGAFVFAVTYALLVPGRALWDVLSWVGAPGFFLCVVVACALAGGLFVAVTGISAPAFVGGGVAAYALWLWYLETALGPFDSPVHLLVGVVYLLGFGIGALAAERLQRSGVAPSTTRSK